jgi:multidrug efflux pump
MHSRRSALLTPFNQRTGKSDLTATAIANRLSQQFSKVEGGQAVVLQPPAVRGIGNAGGFTMQIEDRSGGATPQQLQEATLI